MQNLRRLTKEYAAQFPKGDGSTYSTWQIKRWGQKMGFTLKRGFITPAQHEALLLYYKEVVQERLPVEYFLELHTDLSALGSALTSASSTSEADKKHESEVPKIRAPQIKPARLLPRVWKRKPVIDTLLETEEWQGFSFEEKVEWLLDRAIALVLGEQKQPETIAEWVSRYWVRICASKIDVSIMRLHEIADGAYPTDAELMWLGSVEGLPDVHAFLLLRKCLKHEKSTSESTKKADATQMLDNQTEKEEKNDADHECFCQ